MRQIEVDVSLTLLWSFVGQIEVDVSLTLLWSFVGQIEVDVSLTLLWSIYSKTIGWNGIPAGVPSALPNCETDVDLGPVSI